MRLAIAYALSFAGISCVLVHCGLNNGAQLWKTFRKGRNKEDDDVHMKAMRHYPEVPEWWYTILFIVMFAAAIGVVEGWATFLPWWGFIITIMIPIVFMLPIGVIQAQTNQQIGLNVITEFIAGYIWPGRPIANVLVKTYGYMSMYKGLTFVGDLKLGVYMKLPPKAVFRFQVVGSFLSNFTALGYLLIYNVLRIAVINALIKAVPTLCDPNDPQGFTCPGNNVFYRATVIWGVNSCPTSLTLGHCA
jgi:OPT family oligopeptide transporter